jgi:hypothetical protein
VYSTGGASSMPVWAFVFQPPNGKCAFSKQEPSV